MKSHWGEKTMSLESRLITTEYFKEWDAQILLEILENADNADRKSVV